tara:strand:- start:1434 stop:1832 length:399 start_codon:yes stop_codon:yes gene_type:complete
MLKKTFTLKSGNKPAFKMMAGESPIKENEAVATVVKTPVDQQVKDKEDTPPVETEAEKMARLALEKKAKKKEGWKAAGKIALTALSGGLDAVYGSGKVAFAGDGTKFTDSDAETPEERVARLLERKEIKENS